MDQFECQCSKFQVHEGHPVIQVKKWIYLDDTVVKRVKTPTPCPCTQAHLRFQEIHLKIKAL